MIRQLFCPCREGKKSEQIVYGEKMRAFILICTDKSKENVVSFLMCRHRLDKIERRQSQTGDCFC